MEQFAPVGSLVSDVSSYDPASAPDPRLTQNSLFKLQAMSTSNRGGLFASLRVYLTEAWSVAGGTRIGSDHMTSSVSLGAGGQPARRVLETPASSPRLLV
jgi:hypothetical protein